MKNITFITLLVLLTVMQGYSQQGRNRPGPNEKAERITSRIDSVLNLDEKKMERVENIYMDFFKSAELQRSEMQAMHMEKRNQLLLERNKELKKVLSEEEYEQLMVLMESRPGPPHGANPRRHRIW